MSEDPRSSRAAARRRRGREGRDGSATLFDVLIVGGGPAGLSAALVLGRCRRRVLVVDSGHPRNAASRMLNGYLSRDGISPREFLRLGRDEVARYGVEILDAEVDHARCLAVCGDSETSTLFEVETTDAQTFRSRKILLTTGVRDVLPAIEGIESYYGRGVFHCPYCDGWEYRAGSLVAYGTGSAAVGLALSLRNWSERVTACTEGRRVSPRDRDRLERNGIAIRSERIARLEGSAEKLERVVFEAGPPLACDALFFNTDQYQRSKLPTMLGCQLQKNHQVRTSGRQRTDVHGLFLAGDADGDVQFVIVAAAEGARAAVAINRELQDEDRGEARPSSHPATAQSAGPG